MTLLELIQAACSELGLPRPTTAASSPDTQYQQLFAFINRLGRELTTNYEWQELDREYLLNTVSFTLPGVWTAGSANVTVSPNTVGITTDFGAQFDQLPVWTDVAEVISSSVIRLTQAPAVSGSGNITFSQMRYSLPTDWSKSINQTQWDRSNFWPLAGPKTAQEWQFLKGGIVSTGPRMRFRIQGDKMALNPAPPNAQTLAFEYISDAWVRSAAGVPKSQFTADDDTCIFDDSLMILGTKMYWRQEKGFESSLVEAQFLRVLERKQAQNKGAPVLNMSGGLGNVLLGPWNAQDGGFPGT